MKHKACAKCAASVGTVNVVGNLLMVVVKGYMGVVGGSKGLIAEAIHSCADLLTSIIMIIGMKISGQEKDERYPYGYGKAEYVVAIVIYLFLFFIAIYILYDGMMTIIERRHVRPTGIAIWGAVFSIIVNELMFRQSVCAGNQINSPSMVALAWETRADVYSSIAVLIGIIGAQLGYSFLDPLAAVVVGLSIFKVCIEMTRGAIFNLLDMVPAEIDVEDLRRNLGKRLADVTVDVKNVLAREVGGTFEFNIEVEVPDCLTIAEGEDLKKHIKKIVAGLIERKSRVQILLIPTEQG